MERLKIIYIVVAMTVLSGFGALAIAFVSPAEPKPLMEALFYQLIFLFSLGMGAVIALIGGGFKGSG